jgi:hypothetical protein
MEEEVILDLLRELDDVFRERAPELEVELEVDDDILADPWFQRTESEIALIEDDPKGEIIEIRVRDYGTGFADKRWAF